MKTTVILLLTLGLALADPISKQTVTGDNQPSLNRSESDTTHNEETKLNKGESEQKHQVNENVDSINDVVDEPVPDIEVFIEEAIDLQPDAELGLQPTDSDVLLEQNEMSLADDLYPNEIVEKDPNEIMETAAGFVPLPIIRRRQKPRRRPATRRHFMKNPYRRYDFTYPYYYYGYYRPRSGYYRPSSGYYRPSFGYYRPSSLGYYF